MTLYAVPYTSAAQQEIQRLGETLRRVDVARRTIITPRVFREYRVAAELERPLRAEYAALVDQALDLCELNV